MKYKILLTVDFEVDGVSPGDEELMDRIGGVIIAGIPGVILTKDDDSYAIEINGKELDLIKAVEP